MIQQTATDQVMSAIKAIANSPSKTHSRRIVRARHSSLFDRSQAPHREFDLPIRQLAPAFDKIYIIILRTLVDNLSDFVTGGIERQPKRYWRKAIVQLTTAGHPLG
jgi:hypothetical protein